MRMLSLLGVATLLSTTLVVAAEQVPAGPMLAAHNAVRNRHDLPPLSWSDSLARAAAKWADRLADARGCEMEHANGTGQGENLFWASALMWSDGRREIQKVTPENVVESWASERADYNYATNSCTPGKMCGHYTQVIWKQTTHIGCAKRICPDKSQLWVCRYSPPGNWVGDKPY